MRNPRARQARPPSKGGKDDDLHLLTPAEIAGWDRWALERRARALSKSAYLGGRIALCRVLGRYKMFVDTADIGFASHLLLDGIWQPWTTQFIANCVQSGSTVVDVGANYGYFTLLLADLVGPEGAVLAVEPNAAANTLSARTLAVNGFDRRVEYIETAAGAEDHSEVTLFVPDGEPKNARVIIEGQMQRDIGETRRTPVRRLDLLLAHRNNVKFIKIDVEGSEEGVIAGLMETLRRHRPIVALEYNQARCADGPSLIRRLRSVYPAIERLDFVSGPSPVSDRDIVQAPAGRDQILILR